LIQHFECPVCRTIGIPAALNATLHFHMLYVDGVFDRRADFYPLKPPAPSDLDAITHTIAQRVSCYLEKAGYLERDVESAYLNPDAAHCKPMTKIRWQPLSALPPRRRWYGTPAAATD
jgi:hypothetical protein